jgi:hypothetical protein
MIRVFLSRFFCSAEEKGDRDRLHRELDAIQQKEERMRRDLKRRAKLFPNQVRERGLSYFLSIPGPECSSPRDGLQLLKSGDTMFLSLLLHRLEGAKYIIEALDQSGAWSYFPEVAGTEASIASRGMTIKARLNRSTLRGHFKENFLLFRSRISSREAAHHDFFIGEKVVRAFESAGSKALWKLGANLHRPFTDHKDSLVNQLHEVAFFDWLPEPTNQAPPLNRDQVYCPLDGPVVPIRAAEKTPSFSWEIMCGREWDLYLCPKCLGTFDRRMVKMN